MAAMRAPKSPNHDLQPGQPVHITRLQGAPAQPWRNGGGVTRELLAWSAPGNRVANATGWDLRVSVADITQDGPFSAFPGIDRCFTVLEGEGVVLTVSGDDLCLTQDSAPLTFDGALAPGCRLINGPTRDLNLMVRQSTGRAWMRRSLVDEPWQTIASRQSATVVQPASPLREGLQRHGGPWAWRGLYTQEPACVETPAGRIELEAGTLMWSEAGTDQASDTQVMSPWRLVKGARAWWLGMRTADSAESRP